MLLGFFFSGLLLSLSCTSTPKVRISERDGVCPFFTHLQEWQWTIAIKPELFNICYICLHVLSFQPMDTKNILQFMKKPKTFNLCSRSSLLFCDYFKFPYIYKPSDYANSNSNLFFQTYMSMCVFASYQCLLHRTMEQFCLGGW